MKTPSLFLVVLFLVFSTRLVAQTDMGGMNQNGMGMDSRMNRNSDSNVNSDFKKNKDKKDKKDEFEKMMDKLKVDLKLDDLQFFAIQKTLSDSNRDQNIILKKDISQEEKAAELIAINKKTDIEVNSYLSKEQKEKYTIFNEEKNKRIEKLKTDYQKQ